MKLDDLENIKFSDSSRLNFDHDLSRLNWFNIKGKTKLVRNRKSYKTGYKKAIVTLKKGQSIDLATGI